MTVVAVSPRIRLVLAGVLGVMLVGGAVAASTLPRPVTAPRPGRIASLAPGGSAGSLAGKSLAQAARTCATHAAEAGWANNGTYGGNLVTAAAVCVAESGGRANVFHCDATGTSGSYPPVSCTSGSYDRGLWQLNSKYQPDVTDVCAFRAQCNADAAYGISRQGTSFSPWAVYDSDFYTTYLDVAQVAVSALTSGAVASGVFGVCLARSRPTAGAAAVVGTCGRRTGTQQWQLAGGTLSRAGLCLTAASGSGQPTVSVVTCGNTPGQSWRPHGLAELRNAQTGQCLDDPGASLRAGTALTLARCTTTLEQTWWLP